MNEYIKLDGYKYRTSSKTWKPQIMFMSTSQVLFNGDLDTTFSSETLYLFSGEIVVHNNELDATYGTLELLKATLLKTAHIDLQDHYGNLYEVIAMGDIPERGFSPNWDSLNTNMYVTVQLEGLIK